MESPGKVSPSRSGRRGFTLSGVGWQLVCSNCDRIRQESSLPIYNWVQQGPLGGGKKLDSTAFRDLMLFMSRLVNFLYLVSACLLNLALAPVFALRRPHYFIHRHLRAFADGLLNLGLSYKPQIETISLLQLQELIQAPRPHLHLNFESKFGNINFMEALATSYVAQASKGRTFFEIGTFDGFSAYHLAKNSPSDAVVYTLNLPENSVFEDYAKTYSLWEYDGDRKTHGMALLHGIGSVYKNSDVAHKVRQLFGDSMVFDFTPYWGSIDLCLIDGGHTYAHLQSDTANAFKMLRPGGVVLWHDYNKQHRDVLRFLDELAVQHKLYHIDGTRLVLCFMPKA